MTVTAAAQQSAEAFLQKWRQNNPAWDVAQLYLAPSRQLLAQAWFALLQEWVDAAQANSAKTDNASASMPGMVKLQWWQEELRGWSKGARRHPLGALLQAQPVDWAALAAQLPKLLQAQTQAPALLEQWAQAEHIVLGAPLLSTDAVAAILRQMQQRNADTAVITGSCARVLWWQMAYVHAKRIKRWQWPLRFWWAARKVRALQPR